MKFSPSLGIALGFVLCANLPALAYDVAPVADGGTIKGKVTFNGAIPTRTVIPTKDAEICGEPRKDPLVLLGADKGVKEVAISVQGVAKGKAWPAAGKTPQLDNKACRFVPNVQVIPQGKLAVVNSDPVLHNTHGYYGKRTAFNLALPNKDQSIDVELPRPGAVKVDCDAHGWMLGWIYVVDNPYYAVTNDNGAYEITEVPAGKYTLAINQENFGTITMDVEVKAGQTVDVPIELK
jgi:plastocyanin